jgi:hypothetical protein
MNGRSNRFREGRVIDEGLLQQYKRWLQGQEDKRNGKGCLSANGKYLDGYYNPNQSVPDFLTLAETLAYHRAIARRTLRREQQ